MFKQILFTLLLLVVSQLHVSAQSRGVSGRVVEKSSGTGIAMANVLVKDQNEKVITFATTDSIGAFALSVGDASGMTVSVSVLGYKNYSAPLTHTAQPLVIALEDGALQLKEVTIRGSKIREQGDTLTYNVASFAQKQDRTIGDVLKRMPGVAVDKSGKIQYQGQDINRFYIEGSDLLGGKYGVATNGISYNDVGSVEVMEKHQPLRVLSGVSFSDHAAINLRLKSKSKGTWLTNGHLGGGYSTQPEEGLWNAEVFLMKAQKGYQSITTLKSNNTGESIIGQAQDFLADSRRVGIKSYIGLELPSIPTFGSRRSLLNRSHFVSTNHLWKKGVYEFKANADYCYNREKSTSSSVTQYYLPDGNKNITEDNIGKKHDNKLTGSLTIEANQTRYYLSNTLRTELSWSDISTAMTGTLPNHQDGRLPDHYVVNRLQLIKRFGKNHLVSFFSLNEWENSPQSLTVTVVDESAKDFHQHIGDHAFHSREYAEYSFLFHHLNISLEGGVEANFRNMGSEVYGLMNLEDSVFNDVTTNYLSMQLSPKIEYAIGQFVITARDPMSLTRYFFNQRIGNQSEWLHAPSLKIRWQPTGRLSFSVRASTNKSPIDLHDIHDGLMASNYRSWYRGSDCFYTSSGKGLDGNVAYRNGAQGWFGNAFVSKSWTNSPYQQAQDFRGNDIIYSWESNNTSAQNVTALANISKTLDFIRGVIGFTGAYRHSRITMLSDGVPTLTRQTTYRYGGRLNGNVSRWLFLSYEGMLSISKLGMNNVSQRALHNALHQFGMTVTPISKLSIEGGMDYYHNQELSGNKQNFCFLDAKFTWALSKVADIEFSATNLLNKKTYSYTTYGDLASFSSTRYLRGREVMVTIYLKHT